MLATPLPVNQTNKPVSQLPEKIKADCAGVFVAGALLVRVGAAVSRLKLRLMLVVLLTASS